MTKILFGEDHSYICYHQVNIFVTIVIVISLSLTFCFVSQNSKYSVYHIGKRLNLLYLLISLSLYI